MDRKRKDGQDEETAFDKEAGWQSFKKGSLGGRKRTCPACGRETSQELNKCEHCTSHQEKRWSVKGIIAIGLAMLLVGSVFLSLGAVHEEPVLKIEDLSPDHSFRNIRLEGDVVDINYWDIDYSDYGRLEITIYDGTGLCSVYVQKETLEELVEEGKLPYLGDSVDVHGRFTGSGVESTTHDGEETVRVDGSVTVSEADLFDIKRKEYESFDLNLVSGAGREERLDEHSKARIRGYVGEHRELSSGDYLFYLYRGTEHISVTIPRHSLELTGGWREDIRGEIVTVRGTLNWYEPYWESEGSWELVADGMENIDIIDAHLTYERVSIDELDHAEKEDFNEGSRKQITGSYEWYNSVSAGQLIDIHEGPSSVTVFFPWYAEKTHEDLDELTKGDIVEIKGTLDWYGYGEDRGEWQIIPDGLDSITLIGEKEYNEKDVSMLLDDPEAYEYEYVNLENVVVSSINWYRDDEGEFYTRNFFVKDGIEENGPSLNIYINYWEGRLTELYENDTLTIRGLFKSYTYRGETYWEVVIRDHSRDEIMYQEEVYL